MCLHDETLVKLVDGGVRLGQRQASTQTQFEKNQI